MALHKCVWLIDWTQRTIEVDEFKTLKTKKAKTVFVQYTENKIKFVNADSETAESRTRSRTRNLSIAGLTQ